MSQKFIFTVIYFIMCFSAFAYEKEFFTLEKDVQGIKMITEKSFDKWKTVSLFNKDGFLLQECNYYKNEIRADYRYEYSISDTLLEIRKKEHRNINDNLEEYSIYKYYYDSLKRCYRVESYFSKNLERPPVICNNFNYEDAHLQSYERGLCLKSKDFLPEKFIFFYNEKGQMRQCSYISEYNNKIDTTIYSYFYDEKDCLTDYVVENSNEKGIFMGVVCWSDKKMNKMHIRYTNFDKHGNWTKSYFVTEKGKVFRSKRKIEYW